MNKLVVNVLMVLSCFTISAQDWPDWRGENRDGMWNADGVIDKFDSPQINVKWSVEVGSGYSAPTVSGGKVYLTDLKNDEVQTEGVLCFNEQTGEKIWEYRYDCEYAGVGYPAGPRAAVLINEGKAYSLGTMGNFYCFDAESGEVLWSHDLKEEYEAKLPIWGIAAAPLIVDDKIILQVSGSKNACVVAFHKKSGREIWRNLNEGAAYSAPILVEKEDRRVVVVWTEHSLTGLNPGSGVIHWTIPWTLRVAMGIATPVLYKDHIFVSSFYNGSLLVELGDDYTTAKKAWQRTGESERKTDALHCVMNTPVIIDDYIYGVDSYGELRCLDFSTGDRIWEDQTAVNRNRWANIHFVQNGDNTWMFNEQGELIISRLSPEGFKEISRAKLIEPTKKQLPRGVTWTHPAFANNHVFVRNDEELVCADLSAK